MSVIPITFGDIRVIGNMFKAVLKENWERSMEYDPELFMKTMMTAPQDVQDQVHNAFGVVIITVITFFVLPIMFVGLGWIGHLLLYQLSSSYHSWQAEGMAVRRLILKLSVKSKRNKAMQTLVDEEMKQEASWFERLAPAICLG